MVSPWFPRGFSGRRDPDGGPTPVGTRRGRVSEKSDAPREIRRRNSKFVRSISQSLSRGSRGFHSMVRLETSDWIGRFRRSGSGQHDVRHVVGSRVTRSHGFSNHLRNLACVLGTRIRIGDATPYLKQSYDTTRHLDADIPCPTRRWRYSSIRDDFSSLVRLATPSNPS